MASRLLIEILHGLSIEGLLQNAVLGTSYTAQLTARNAVLPLRWEKIGGAWPATGGWTIDTSTGLVTGTANDAGWYDIAIQCTDGAGSFGVKNFRFRVAAAPLVFAGDLPDATVGDSAVYSYTISGGVGTKTVSLVSGTLPAGASIDSAGNVTGTYTTGGSYAWTLRVVDGDLTEAFLSDSSVIAWPVLSVSGAFTDTVYGSPLVGSPLAIAGGDGAYSLSGAPYSGTRPDGVTIAVSGASLVATGSTSAAGTFAWTERVLSGDGQHVDVACHMDVTQVKDIYLGGGFSLLAGVTRNRIGSFTQAGVLTSFDPNASNNVYSIAKQQDGKIIFCGGFSLVGGVSRDKIARVNPDGSLDAGFTTSLNGTTWAVAMQSTGKILVGGQFNQVNGVSITGFARLNADGSLDSGVGGHGDVRSIAVLPSGKIWIGGNFSAPGYTRLALLNADCSIDTSLADPLVNSLIRSLAVQADGKVVIGGQFTSVGGSTTRNRIARINPDGTIDAFNPDANGEVRAVAVQMDGKIIVGGTFTTIGGVARNRVARLNADGTLDASFNPNANSSVLSIDIQADGKILVVGGFSNIAGTSREKGARLNADGSIDLTFNPVINYSPAEVVRVL